MDWNHVLDWRLLGGSHDFPGPDGGTCINEAAVVAAGMAYRKINGVRDCPPCFSRVIAAYAIGCNDAMPDDLRQELLMPFVTRLAGTADGRSVEQRRIDLIVVRTIRDVLPILLRLRGRYDLAERCTKVGTREETGAAALLVSKAMRTNAAAAHAYLAHAYAADPAVAHATAVARAAAADPAARREVWAVAVSILDEAIKLGRQADPIDTRTWVERLELAKRRGAALAEAPF